MKKNILHSGNYSYVKRKRKLLLVSGLMAFALLFMTLIPGYAQKKKRIGSVNEILLPSGLLAPQAVTTSGKILPTTEEDVEVHVRYDQVKGDRHRIAGTVIDAPGSNVYLSVTNGKLKGKVVIPSQKAAYIYSSDSDGNAYVESANIDTIVCVGMPEASLDTTRVPALPAAVDITNLQSLPGAEAVVMLDFDGQYVIDPHWNGGEPIDAQPAVLSDDEIYEVFKLISEDFRPFQLNITTNETVYQAAPANRRMRVIFTPTNTAGPGTGGVAYIGAFTWGTDTPCWVFNSGIKGAGEAGSHETGHTVGLSHDGRELPDGTHEEYYAGQGMWAPIMGEGYSREVVQWSKGEYQYANNQQDDIAIIVSQNGFGFKTDDVGNIEATAQPLVVDSTGNIGFANNFGIITTRVDVDFYKFTVTSPSTLTLDLQSGAYPDLDILLDLFDSSGTLVQSVNPVDDVNAQMLSTLSPGTYYLSVTGTGNRDPFTDGYSDYASLGKYTISGSLIPAVTVGINGPSCVESGQTYEFLLNPPSGDSITYSTLWANGDAVVSRDSLNPRVFYITFLLFNQSFISLGAVVDFTVAPWSQTYSKIVQVNGCPASSARMAAHAVSSVSTSPNSGGLSTVKVFDLNGRNILTDQVRSINDVIASDELPSGFYIIQVITDSGSSYTKKIVKGN